MGAVAPVRGGAGRSDPGGSGFAIGVAWLATVASASGQVVLLIASARRPEMEATVVPTDVVGPVASVALASLGGLVVLRSDARRYGWLMLAMGLTTGLVGAAGLYSVYGHVAGSGTSLPLTATAGWVQDLWMVFWLLGFLLLPALFPDGTVASPRWWRPVRIAAGVWVALIVAFMLAERPLTNFMLEVPDPPANPTGVLPVPEMAVNVTWIGVTVASLGIGIGSLVARWRRADADLRQRLKWVLFAFGVLLTVAATDIANQTVQAGLGVDLGLHVPINVLMAAAVVGLVAALGIAVLNHRLYDIDLVINRTIVYGLLTVALLAAYVAVVAGVGAWLPVDDRLLSLVATGIVAVAFAPMRERVQRLVNRVMFGRRDDPYAVLSELGRLLARSGTPKATLQTLAETIATSMKLPGAAIDLEQDGGWRRVAAHGGVDRDDRGLVVPLRHQGQAVGRLVVAPRSPRERLSAQDRRLLEDVAHHAGALAQAVRLTMALQRSRERLVATREEERRRIRRDLHDGLGPSLASQTFRLDAVLERLHDDPDGAAELVAALKDHNQQLVADIRRLVHELRPPALDELGVAGALAAHAGQLERNGGPTITVGSTPDPLPTLPAAVEVAAYRIAREAITNVVRHADATRCTASLQAADSTLSIVISDDGVGIDSSAAVGVGLVSMRERADELGGMFAISSTRTGTRVRATLPISGWLDDRPGGHQAAAAEGGAARD